MKKNGFEGQGNPKGVHFAGATPLNRVEVDSSFPNPVLEWTILTNAPEGYDYGITVKFSNPVLGTADLRLVECYTEQDLIDRGEAPESARWRMEQQALRYGSGMYLASVEPTREDYDYWRKRK